MLILVAGTLLAAFLVGKFWGYILNFLNGPVRDFLEKLLGPEKCDWYVKFLLWVDDKISAVIQLADEWCERFKNNVLMLKSTYKEVEGSKGRTFIKTHESIVALDSLNAKRVVTEEIVGREELPDDTRHEMIRQRSNEAAIDERDVVMKRYENKKIAIEMAH